MGASAALFELRCYTLRPGATTAFWQAQVERGFDLVAPIQQRLVGYFASADEARPEQVWHLYRYDGFDDWRARLHGLYGVAALEPYFARVRALMTAQENRFMVAAPLAVLSPLWHAGRDWQPDAGTAVAPLPQASPHSVVEACTTVLLPGTQPRWWQAWRDAEATATATEVLQPDSLLGCFVTLVGRQHQLLTLRHHASAQTLQQARNRRLSSPAWQAWQQAVAPLVAEEHTALWRPAPLPELAPLFHPTAQPSVHTPSI